MCAAARLARGELIVAVPVATKESVDVLERLTDMIIVIQCSSYYDSVGEHYGDFTEVNDDEVERIIKKSSSNNKSISIVH